MRKSEHIPEVVDETYNIEFGIWEFRNKQFIRNWGFRDKKKDAKTLLKDTLKLHPELKNRLVIVKYTQRFDEVG